MKTLEITIFNTIRKKGNKNTEMLLEDFVRKLEKKTKSKKYGVEYNKDKSLFITYQGEENCLWLYKPNFENCSDEKRYDDCIARLKRLADISLEMEKAKEDKENEEKRIAKIIEDAENGKPLDNEGRTIYLDYLKKQKIFLSNLKERRKEFLEDDFIPTSVCLFSSAGIGFIIGLILTFFLNNLDWSLITTVIGFSFYSAAGFCQALRDSARMKKSIKQKIKSLEEQLGITNVKDRTQHKTKKRQKNKAKTKTKSISRNTINFEEQIKPYPYNFKDIIYKRANTLLDRVECLNDDEAKLKIKSKIGELLKEYSDGLKLAKNVGSVELEASKYNSIEELQTVTVSGLVDRLGGRLDQMNISVNRMLGNQISEIEREKERLLTEERLEDKPVVIDKEKIDGVLKQREDNLIPIEMKTCHETSTRKSKK